MPAVGEGAARVGSNDVGAEAAAGVALRAAALFSWMQTTSRTLIRCSIL